MAIDDVLYTKMELLDFLSGLLLTMLVLAVLVYLIKEIFADQVAALKKVRHYVAGTVARHVRSEAKPVNDHLIGSIGRVIAHSGDSKRPMRVRVGLERWSARLNSSEDGQLPVGAPVKVTAIDGLILVVEALAKRQPTAEHSVGNQ